MKTIIVILVLLAAVLAAVLILQPDLIRRPVERLARVAPEAQLDDLEFEHGALRWSIRGGAQATIAQVQLNGKELVADNREPLLTATLLHAPDYRADADWFPYHEEHSDYHVDDIVPLNGNGSMRGAQIQGRLAFDAGTIRFTLRIEGHPEPAHLSTALTLDPEGSFDHRLLHDLRLQLPLALDWRKRIGQGGDRGLDWDTRYFYEFTYGTVRLAMPPQSVPHPDRNEWRIFSVDQLSPLHFRIWRSESDGTSPLAHQVGQVAAGWTSVYDAGGGMLVGYRDLADHAPKSLRVEPAGRGRIAVQLHPASQSAEPLDSSLLQRSLWGATHRVDLLPFSGEAPDARPDTALAAIWNRPAPLSGERPARGMDDLSDAGWSDWTHADPPAHLGPYVQGGVPLRRGALTDPHAVGLYRGATRIPVQTKPLAFWPDGSIKWLHLVFPVPPAVESAEPPPSAPLHAFRVTFRNRADEAYTLHAGLRGTPPSVDGAVRVEEAADGRIRVGNGQLSLTLGTGVHWLQRLEAGGRVLHEGAAGGAPASVDFLLLDDTYPAGNAHPRGQPDDGPVNIERIEVEETGPLRAIVRLEGRTQSREPTHITMRLKVFARRPWVEIRQSAVFDFKDPRKTLVRNFELALPYGAVAADAAVHVGFDGHTVSHPGASPVMVIQESPLGGRVDAFRDGRRTRLRDIRAGDGWILAGDDAFSAGVMLRNFREEFPSALAYDPLRGRLSAGFWPAAMPLMDVRRYSNYPHQPQGESAGVGSGNRWVDRSFYPGDHVFVGISKSHQAAWVFLEGHAAPAQMAGINADFQSRPLIYSGADAYRETRITLPVPDYRRFPKLAENLTNFTDFWLFHQRFWNWYGFWNHGDFQHRFRSGYGRVVDVDRMIEIWQMPEAERPATIPAQHLTVDYHPQQDWAFDNGRWGWTNTEGLPGLYLQNEYFRTGRRDIFFAAEAMARYARDVITRHAGAYAGQGTRHGVQPWSDGNHDPRSTVFAEYRFHYYLTGESRSREVMERMATEFYNRGTIRESSYHSARLYGLFTWWEFTGKPEARDRIRDYVHQLVTPEGMATGATVAFTEGGVQRRTTDGLNGTSMFFHNFGAMHALLEYVQVTGDPVLGEGLMRMAAAIGLREPATDRAARAAVRGVGWLAKLYSFAAVSAADPAPFEARIRAWMNTEVGENMRYQLVSSNPRHWTGDTAFMTGLTPGTFFVANNLPLFHARMEREPERSGALTARLAQRDEAGGRNPKPRLSWQTEHDHPALRDYFGPWRPPEFSDPNPQTR